MNKSLKKACKIVGSQGELARKLGVTRQAVQYWMKNEVPPNRVLAVERATGGQVTRYQLRKDLYGKAP